MAVQSLFHKRFSSNLDVSKLITDIYSGVKHVRKTLHIALNPAYIGREVKGVQDVFNGWLYQYVRSLNGVLLDFKKMSFVQGLGSILSDQPHIHYDVSADFYIYQPVVGAAMSGTVNKVSRKHVGCLVHGCINVSLSCPAEEDSLLDLVTVGQEIHFTVESVESKHHTLRVHGTITDFCTDQFDSVKPWEVQKEKVNGFSAIDDIAVIDASELDQSPASSRQRKNQQLQNEEGRPISKKKKKKWKHNDEGQSETSTSCQIGDDDVLHRKKKKHRKVGEEEPQSEETGSSHIYEDVLSRKRKKKNRQGELGEGPSAEEQQSEESSHGPSRKSKKKLRENEGMFEQEATVSNELLLGRKHKAKYCELAKAKTLLLQMTSREENEPDTGKKKRAKRNREETCLPFKEELSEDSLSAALSESSSSKRKKKENDFDLKKVKKERTSDVNESSSDQQKKSKHKSKKK